MEGIPLQTYWAFLDSPSLLRLSRASRTLRARVSEPWLTALALRRDGLPAPLPPPAPPLAPADWLAALARFHPTAPGAAAPAVASRLLLPRAQRVWAGLAAFCAAHALPLPLLPPPTPSEVAGVEARLGVTFPHALRALLSVHGGQALQSAWGGLLGGVQVYNLQRTSFLLPGGLAHLERATLALRARSPPGSPLLLPIAAGGAAPFFVDCCPRSPTRGMVWRLSAGQDVQPAAAGAPRVPSWQRHASEGPCEDALLSWLEEYLARLEGGEFAVESSAGTAEEEEEEEEGEEAGAPPPPRYISAFSERQGAGSHCTSAHGITIHVSVLPLAHSSRYPRSLSTSYEEYAAQSQALLQSWRSASPYQRAGGEHVEEAFTYRVTMWREAEAPAARPGEHGTLRLTRRAWSSQDGEGGAVQVMGGPGVIGLFPQLARGGRRFRYASQTGFERLPGAMWGSMFFRVEGGGEEEVEASVGRFVCKSGGEDYLYF